MLRVTPMFRILSTANAAATAKIIIFTPRKKIRNSLNRFEVYCVVLDFFFFFFREKKILYHSKFVSDKIFLNILTNY